MKDPVETPQDHGYVRTLVLSALANEVGVRDLFDRLVVFHRRNRTYPAEVLLELGADAIDESGATRAEPIYFEDIRERFMPELDLRKKEDHYKSKWAVRASAMIHAGVDPGLLEEATYWHRDNAWYWALDAAVIYSRAAADYLGVEVADVARALAVRHDITLLDGSSWADTTNLRPSWFDS